MNIIIFFFSIFSLAHFTFKNYVIDQNGEIDNKRQTGFTTLIFGIIMSLIIFILNFVTIGNKCNENKALIYHSLIAFLPWAVVYGTITIIFRNFPGWKAPFSNTFGYLFVRFLKANTLIIDLFNTLVFAKENPTEAKNMTLSDKKSIMNNIYKDQSVMLNVITLENINSMWSSLFGNIEEAQQYKEKLYKIITIKDKVSEFIWFLLLSTIAYTISNRYITTIRCDKNAEHLEDIANKLDSIIKN